MTFRHPYRLLTVMIFCLAVEGVTYAVSSQQVGLLWAFPITFGVTFIAFGVFMALSFAFEAMVDRFTP